MPLGDISRRCLIYLFKNEKPLPPLSTAFPVVASNLISWSVLVDIAVTYRFDKNYSMLLGDEVAWIWRMQLLMRLFAE
jgi:hypothetical protein